MVLDSRNESIGSGGVGGGISAFGLLGVVGIDSLAGRRGNEANSNSVVETWALNNAINSNGLAVQAGINTITSAIDSQSLSNATAAGQYALAAQQGFSGVKDSVQTLATALSVAIGNVNQNVLLASKDALAATAASTSTILQAIASNTEAELRQKLTVAQLEASEERSRRSHDAISFKIDNSNTVNQSQQQAQMQFQLQQQGALLNSMYPLAVGTFQHAQATNANIIAGNSGAVTTGAQTSTPTNVNA